MPTSTPELRRWRTSCWFSASLHGLAVGGFLGYQLLELTWLGELPSNVPTPITLVVRADWELTEPPVVRVEMTPDKEELPDEAPALADVPAQIEAAITAAQAKPVEEQRNQLEELAERLNNVSTEKSVDAMAAKLQQVLGAAPRATAPAEKPVSGEFDTSTAQLHDVRREEAADGEFRYLVVLIDAAGRSFESELGPAEGEQLYRTWQLIKKNPLLERVYRGVVIQLLDKLLSSKR